MVIDPKTSKPRWNVLCKYDEEAIKKYKLEESYLDSIASGNVDEEFDCLIGCDGPRSPVRSTQTKYFGDIEKRKFMDAVGIV